MSAPPAADAIAIATTKGDGLLLHGARAGRPSRGCPPRGPGAPVPRPATTEAEHTAAQLLGQSRSGTVTKAAAEPDPGAAAARVRPRRRRSPQPMGTAWGLRRSCASAPPARGVIATDRQYQPRPGTGGASAGRCGHRALTRASSSQYVVARGESIRRFIIHWGPGRRPPWPGPTEPPPSLRLTWSTNSSRCRPGAHRRRPTGQWPPSGPGASRTPPARAHMRTGTAGIKAVARWHRFYQTAHRL